MRTNSIVPLVAVVHLARRRRNSSRSSHAVREPTASGSDDNTGARIEDVNGNALGEVEDTSQERAESEDQEEHVEEDQEDSAAGAQGVGGKGNTGSYVA